VPVSVGHGHEAAGRVYFASADRPG